MHPVPGVQGIVHMSHPTPKFRTTCLPEIEGGTPQKGRKSTQLAKLRRFLEFQPEFFLISSLTGWGRFSKKKTLKGRFAQSVTFFVHSVTLVPMLNL